MRHMTRQKMRTAMNIHRVGRSAWLALLLTAAITTHASAETSIRFILDFKIEGPSAPFLVGLDKNYYSAEGLNVTIEPSLGSLQPIERVASGEYEMGFGDINTFIKFRDTKPGTPVKAVFMVYNRPPYAVIGRKSRGIASPKDLEGKTLGAPSAGGAFAEWPIFAQVNKIDVSKVAIENVGFPVREPMLAAGQVDAITGYSFTSYVNLKEKGVPVDDIVVLLMADYGVTLYGNAILVNTKFASEHPDAVQGFLRAFLKGLKDTVKQPAAAIESVIKRNGEAAKKVELERLTMAIRENIVTPEVKAEGYGAVDADRFARALDQIAITYKFKAKPKLDDIFDASFLPAAAARKYN
jgi:NitT/TauT family transport system substrate-binding protein